MTTRINTYPEALQWLFQRNQFSIKLGLKKIQTLLNRLGNPEKNGVYLHVAGTNGKGSVCANLGAMLPTLGYQRIGLYTSPHLVSFRERIRIDGEAVSTTWVTNWLQKHLDLLEELDATYFECATAMALVYFQENECGAVVLETGLGGRLDATNAVTPRISVITSISLDHMAHLGNSLESIMGEKLGILKPRIPAIIDEGRSDLAQLAEHTAEALGVPLANLAHRWKEFGQNFQVHGAFGTYLIPSSLRTEDYQKRNVGLSILALETFYGKKLPPEETWIQQLRSSKFPGRTQWLESEDLIPLLLDGAHNSEGVEALCRNLQEQNRGLPRIFFAMMKDKEVGFAYQTLRTMSLDIHYLDLHAIYPRALTFSELSETLAPQEKLGLNPAPMTWEALAPLLRKGSGADFGVICGSLYLLGELIPILHPHYRGLEAFAKLLAEEKPILS